MLEDLAAVDELLAVDQLGPVLELLAVDELELLAEEVPDASPSGPVAVPGWRPAGGWRNRPGPGGRALQELYSASGGRTGRLVMRSMR